MPRQEILVLVDDHDKELGTETREKCHTGRGLRHRAYVVFLFHKGKLLLQQRSENKLLWPKFWDVSYTSHVYPDESYSRAAERKAMQELNAKIERLEDVYSFVYWAPFGNYSENEYCKLLVGDFDGKMAPNPDEIMATKYLTVEELAKQLKSNGDHYTPWLKLAFEGFMKSKLPKRYLS